MFIDIIIAVILGLMPATGLEQEPYGGCDEAWQAPLSEGAAWCRAHG